MFHKQVAVQMLDLMAEATGSNPLVLHLEPLAVTVLRLDTHHIGAGHLAVFPGYAEAALQRRLLPFGIDDLRVDQLDDLVVLVQHDTNAAQDTHLRGCQTHAAGFLQRFRHIVQQRMQPVVEFRHRTAYLGEAFLTLQCDLPKCHVPYL